MMINLIYRGLIAENQKIKGTFTFWFTIIASLLVPSILFIVYLFQNNYFIPDVGVNPWDTFINDGLKYISNFLFPIYVILTIAVSINIEHKENSWKKLFVLPIKRESLFFIKLLFLLLQIFVSLLIFAASILIFGGILGFIHSELLFLDYIPNIIQFGKLILHLFIAILGIFSIQYFLNLWFKNIIIPISLGLFLIIIASVVTYEWKNAMYFPYSFPTLFQMNLSFSVTDTYGGFAIYEIASFGIFLGINLLGIILFKNKRIK